MNDGTVLLIATAGPLAERLHAALARELPGHEVLLAEGDDGVAASSDTGSDTLLNTAPTTASNTTPAAAIYLADRARPDLDAARRHLTAAVAAGADHLVLVSSAEAVAPHHHHPGLIAEEHPRAQAGGNPIADAWLALEAAARTAVDDRAPLTILRPAPMPVAGGDDFWSRYLAGRFAPTIAGLDPTLQLLSPGDLASAIAAALRGGVDGLCHVAPREAIPLHAALRRAGPRRLPLPAPLTGLPAARRAYLSHSWTVRPSRLRQQAGWQPRQSSADAAAGLRSRPAAGEVAPETFDDFGLDRAYIRRHGRRLLGFLHDRYWRVELAGVEQIPRQGRAVLVGVHRGFMPFDGVMALHAVVRELGRFPRFLIHPALVKFPFLANFITKLGGVVACQENADHVLERDGLLGVFPEGIQGAFTFYRRAYRLGRFGRDEYVKMALRHRAPIVPFVTVGSAEIFPILGALRWRWVRRLTEWPFLPVTPTLGLVPLPSKWHTWFLEPLHVEVDHGPEAADDPAVVRLLSNEVRRRMEAGLAVMLARRKSIFHGEIFGSRAGQPAAAPAAPDRAAPRRAERRKPAVPTPSTPGRTL